ncbi:hypothetical protein RVS70_05300 [Virgibacillus sp. M23]|uniref:hypothetical protein n=1 Tax=Virgibacillus sp. M23 TaxID=3079030 RepID=UPI002A918D38|nr:hypothetical protein [Virgibacillus sp. M23]MDY7043617.1 hypothetical protein [Virgibacillus sp. M23]
MNKRQKKKMMKKELAKYGKDYGLVIYNTCEVKHYYPIGTIVKVTDYGYDCFSCIGITKKKGLEQSVLEKDILIYKGD